MNSLTYQQTLDIIEKFMIDSGIRNFCTNICHGQCCSSCWESKYACHRNEGRRLSCSFYLCPWLSNKILSSKDEVSLINKPSYTIYYEIKNKVLHIISDLLKKENPKKLISNVYFTPHSKWVRDNFVIDSKTMEGLKLINIDKIRSKVKGLKLEDLEMKYNT